MYQQVHHIEKIPPPTHTHILYIYILPHVSLKRHIITQYIPGRSHLLNVIMMVHYSISFFLYAAVSLSFAFNLDLSHTDVYTGAKDAFFGYKVLQNKKGWVWTFCCLWWSENNSANSSATGFRLCVTVIVTQLHKWSDLVLLCLKNVPLLSVWSLVSLTAKCHPHGSRHIHHQGNHHCTLAAQWLWVCVRVCLAWSHGNVLQPKRYFLCFLKHLLCKCVWLLRQYKYIHI